MPGVVVARSDQCRWGQWAVVEEERVHARKRTGWMTSMAEWAKALDGLCKSDDKNADMVNGQAKRTQRYPPALVRIILKVVRCRLRHDRGMSTDALACSLEVGIGLHVDEAALQADSAPDWRSAEMARRYLDVYTGLELRRRA